MTARAQQSNGTLGTFGGVFTPSLLTILGLVLFLRLGYVVGSVGLTGALVILALSTSVSVLTSTSLAAIATNFKVRLGAPPPAVSAGQSSRSSSSAAASAITVPGG